MKDIIHWFGNVDPVMAAFVATTFTWFATAAGASLVFFFKTLNRAILDIALGFTGGVMVAASVWSLIMPALEMTDGAGFQKLVLLSLDFY